MPTSTTPSTDPRGAAPAPSALSDLTDRYVHVATTRLPASQRADVERELRATAADMVEARLDGAGVGAASPAGRRAAEAAALEELGDPQLLAAGYAARPQALIGPEVYPAWRGLLVVLLAVVPPIATAGAALAQVLSGSGAVDALVSALVVGLGAALHVAFWTTLAFAVVERTTGGGEQRREPPARWTVDRLPDPQEDARRRQAAVDAVASVVVDVLALAGLAWLLRGWEGSPVINPGLGGWLWVLVAALVAGTVVDGLRLPLGGWTRALAAAVTLVDAVVVAVVLGWTGEPLLAPALVDDLAAATGSARVAGGITASVLVVVVLVAVAEVVLAWRAAARRR